MTKRGGHVHRGRDRGHRFVVALSSSLPDLPIPHTHGAHPPVGCASSLPSSRTGTGVRHGYGAGREIDDTERHNAVSALYNLGSVRRGMRCGVPPPPRAPAEERGGAGGRATDGISGCVLFCMRFAVAWTTVKVCIDRVRQIWYDCFACGNSHIPHQVRGQLSHFSAVHRQWVCRHTCHFPPSEHRGNRKWESGGGSPSRGVHICKTISKLKCVQLSGGAVVPPRFFIARASARL